MEHLQAYNKKLLSNILPVHVADHFISCDKNYDVSLSYLLLQVTMAILQLKRAMCGYHGTIKSASGPTLLKRHTVPSKGDLYYSKR